MLLLVPGLHPPPDDPTFSVEGLAGSGRIVGYRTLPLQFSDTHKATTVDLGQGGLEDVILELDWEDGTEDLLPAAGLVFPTRTNDGRTLHIVQDGRGHLILHYQSLGVPLQGLRAHRFARPDPDISALLARLELEGAADSGLYRPPPTRTRRPGARLLRGPWPRALPGGARHPGCCWSTAPPDPPPKASVPSPTPQPGGA